MKRFLNYVNCAQETASHAAREPSTVNMVQSCFPFFNAVVLYYVALCPSTRTYTQYIAKQ